MGLKEDVASAMTERIAQLEEIDRDQSNEGYMAESVGVLTMTLSAAVLQIADAVERLEGRVAQLEHRA